MKVEEFGHIILIISKNVLILVSVDYFSVKENNYICNYIHII